MVYLLLRSLKNSLALVLFFSLGFLSAQESNFDMAKAAIQNAENGVLLVVVEQFENNIAALEKQVKREKNTKQKERLKDQITFKQEFRTLYEEAASYALERHYTFGRYKIVHDTDLKATRDSLKANQEGYLLLVHRYSADELALLNSDNVTIPKPFPQKFEGLLVNIKQQVSKDFHDPIVYRNFFAKSIYELNRQLQDQKRRINYKHQKKVIKELSWLEGSWKLKRENGTEITETWSRTETGYLGESLVFDAENTRFQENMKLYFENDTLRLVVSGNNFGPTIFSQIETDVDRYIFQNLQNDFPTHIEYWSERGVVKARIYSEEKELNYDFEENNF